ncbi:hypothetical protein RchiOBHm_Chr3g0475271 [Rosa chinensis]|uniref:Uncharacterized protein n=1 Tax=Rosa chinensis TaxID=74649 RepID=A0A2P6RCB6_ROSCH|nr:hypothetical protein RchiOBHm_Chr3g0475271 [Rosa chinensis]
MLLNLLGPATCDIQIGKLALLRQIFKWWILKVKDSYAMESDSKLDSYSTQIGDRHNFVKMCLGFSCLDNFDNSKLTDTDGCQLGNLTRA